MIAGADLGTVFIAAIALLLVFEGLLPFFSPALWRRVFEQAIRLTDQQIRFFGLGSMLTGLLILLLI